MLVEDDNNLREIYAARLQAEGHEIVAAKDGEEALALAVKEKPELIISDVMMPRISGFDMLDILRNAPETKNTKVIMMTALSQAEDKARADKLGADRYLVKSQVTLEDVARTVKDVLEGKPAPAHAAPQAPVAASEAPVPAPSPVAAAPPAAPTVRESAEPVKTPEPAAQPAQQPTDDSAATPQAQDNSTNAPLKSAAADLPVASPPSNTPSDDTATASTGAPAPAEPATPPKTDTPTPIKVELPTPPDEQKPEEPAQPAADAHQKPVNETVGPTLAEALANEEQAANREGSKTPLDAPSPSAIANGAPAPVVIPVVSEPTEPTAPEISTQEEPAAEPPKQEKDPVNEPHPAEQIAGKKVIRPINDPTKKPDLNQLLAKEEQMAAAKNPAANTVIKPLPTNSELPADPAAGSKPADNHNDDIAL